MKGVSKNKKKKNNEIILSKSKAIVFGIIIDILMSFIISVGSYDIITAFYGEKMAIDKSLFASILYPAVFVIVGSILISYLLISIKWDNKKAK